MQNPPLQCVVSISGIRGIVGETLDPGMVLALGAAVGHRLAKRKAVVVGRDSRPTGGVFFDALSAGLRSAGASVIDVGVVPTPTVPLLVRHHKAGAGIQLSASHNPVQWNALKIYTKLGRNIDNAELQTVLKAYENPAKSLWVGWDKHGSLQHDARALDTHLKAVLKAVDVSAIRARKFKVVLDSVNGSGATLGPLLLDALGCEVVPINSRIDRVFPRDPEPTAANVVETGAIVKAVGADIGFVQDPDADRLACIDHRGKYIGEEYTLVLCAGARIAAAKAAGQRSPKAVTNVSTSRMIDDLAAELGGKVIRSAVGEANVLDAMDAAKAVVGGEGNGGVIDPRVVSCRDSQVGMALVLDHLARRGHSLADEVAAIPAYAMHKEKVALDRAQVTELTPAVADWATARKATIDYTDGVKCVWPDRWVHLRASGTEPVSRIISEAPDARSARKLAKDLRDLCGATIVTGH